MKRAHILSWALGASLVLALIAACGGGSDTSTKAPAANSPTVGQAAASTATTQSTSAGQPTATGAAQATSTSADAKATATALEETAPTSTPDTTGGSTATTSGDGNGARLTGKASVDDVSGDIVNILGNAPDNPMPGMDLRKVQIEGDGTQVVVTITTEGDIAAELSADVDIAFDVHLWQDDRPAYAMSFHHKGSGDWEAVVTDFGASLMGTETTIDTPISVNGNTISEAFPADMMPDLRATFQWYSSDMHSPAGMMIGLQSYLDGAPDNVIALLANPDKFVEFPQ
jgi:hypothetical protein